MYEYNNAMNMMDSVIERIGNHIEKDVDISYMGTGVILNLQGLLTDYDYGCDGLVLGVDNHEIIIDVDTLEPYIEDQFEGTMIEFRNRSDGLTAVTILLHI